jgi:hypothetical protein
MADARVDTPQPTRLPDYRSPDFLVDPRRSGIRSRSRGRRAAAFDRNPEAAARVG